MVITEEKMTKSKKLRNLKNLRSQIEINIPKNIENLEKIENQKIQKYL